MKTTTTAIIAAVLTALALNVHTLTATLEQPVTATTTPTTSFAGLAAPMHPYADGVQPNEAPGMSDGVRVYEDGSYVTDAGEHGCLEYAPCTIK